MKPNTPEEEERRREQVCEELRRALGITGRVEIIHTFENDGKVMAIGVRVVATNDTHYFAEPILLDKFE